MRDEMKNAVETMLKTDPTVPDALRVLGLRVLGLNLIDDEKTVTAIYDLVNGDTVPELMQPIVTRKDAARLLHVKPHTVDLYGRMGLLQRVYGSGAKKIGFTRESVLKKAAGDFILPGTYKITTCAEARAKAQGKFKARRY